LEEKLTFVTLELDKISGIGRLRLTEELEVIEHILDSAVGTTTLRLQTAAVLVQQSMQY